MPRDCVLLNCAIQFWNVHSTSTFRQQRGIIIHYCVSVVCHLPYYSHLFCIWIWFSCIMLIRSHNIANMTAHHQFDARKYATNQSSSAVALYPSHVPSATECNREHLSIIKLRAVRWSLFLRTSVSSAFGEQSTQIVRSKWIHDRVPNYMSAIDMLIGPSSQYASELIMPLGQSAITFK